jgi:hypothetical protein
MIVLLICIGTANDWKVDNRISKYFNTGTTFFIQLQTITQTQLAGFYSSLSDTYTSLSFSLVTIMFEDSKGLIRIRKSKDRQHYDQTKRNKRTNNDLQKTTQKSKYRATRIQLLIVVNSEWLNAAQFVTFAMPAIYWKTLSSKSTHIM